MFEVRVVGNFIEVSKLGNSALIPVHEAINFINSGARLLQTPGSVTWGEITFPISDTFELDGLIDKMIEAVKEISPGTTIVCIRRHRRPVM